MKPTLVTPDVVEGYLNAGHWSRETMVGRYQTFASNHPEATACSDSMETYTWAELDSLSDHIAARLIDLGVSRDAVALVHISSSCKEIVLRSALKKAGIIGVFTPLQWSRKELSYVIERAQPELVVTHGNKHNEEVKQWLAETLNSSLLIDLDEQSNVNWISWSGLLDTTPNTETLEVLPLRGFRFDEVSLITASSGTSGMAKLCEWPEGAQVCQSRVLCDRMKIKGDDKVGIFAPTSGAAGLMMWMVSWTVPCTTVFPDGYTAPILLDLIQDAKITVGTTVPVILVRLIEESLESWDLRSLRLIRIGTAATDVSAALAFEDRSGCKVVIASGSMECTGFGHAHINEPKELRLNGTVGLPLEGGRLRIENDDGEVLPFGTVGELKVTAPFSSSGYWKDPDENDAVWCNGWYSTGDLGMLDEKGRLTLLGRLKETINRSGHKILPTEIENEILNFSEVIECSVVGAPDPAYGEVPWAFVRLIAGLTIDPKQYTERLVRRGLASYKIPSRYIEVEDFPRINDNKVNKKALFEMAQSILKNDG